MEIRPLALELPDQTAVSALLLRPEAARLIYVLGHGAGAGMDHHFLEAVVTCLAERGVATFRYQFPYMEAGRRSPDAPRVLETTVRAAIAAAESAAPNLPLVAGGKSLGGRITSHVAANNPSPTLRGLIFLGYPLHAPNKPDTRRAAHLTDIDIPMLFLQGTRDKLANLELLRPIIGQLGGKATLHVVDGGDHSFSVLKRSGRREGQVMNEIADAIVEWLHNVV